MQIRINGETREFGEHLSLNELVRELSLAPERIAIELNQHVIRRSEWPQTILNEGDRLEIVHFVGGGESSRQKAVGRAFIAHSRFQRFLFPVATV